MNIQAATPVRRDGHHPIVFMHCGPVRYKVDARRQAEKRPFDHFVIPRFTPFRKPVSRDEREWSITEIYAAMSTSEIRNRLIIDDVISSVNEGRNPLILTERTAHVETLSKALREVLPNVVTLTGSMSGKERQGFTRCSRSGKINVHDPWWADTVILPKQQVSVFSNPYQNQEAGYNNMKMYFDMNVFNRIFDDQSQIRIRFETMAIDILFELIEKKQYTLVWSFILEHENSRKEIDVNVIE